MRRRGGPRIVGPWVPRVASPQFLADFRIGPLPEAAEVASGLHRPAIRRQQFDGHRLADAGRRAESRPARTTPAASPKRSPRRRRDRSSGVERPLGTISDSGAPRVQPWLRLPRQRLGDAEIGERARGAAACSAIAGRSSSNAGEPGAARAAAASPRPAPVPARRGPAPPRGLPRPGSPDARAATIASYRSRRPRAPCPGRRRIDVPTRGRWARSTRAPRRLPCGPAASVCGAGAAAGHIERNQPVALDHA